MAPFVRRQYGDELYAVMRELKALCDPDAILNPGIVLTDDGSAHLRHLKVVPAVETEVDRCVECGYCEPVCPSRDLTTTPRQRIVLRRELAAARLAGDADLVRELTAAYGYAAEQTCAVDGMCATACPVGINTGDLVKALRAASSDRAGRTGWTSGARHWDNWTRVLARALDVASSVPPAVPARLTRVARRLLGPDQVPQWSHDLPHGGTRRHAVPTEDADAVYLPSCLGTLFAPAPTAEHAPPAASGAGVSGALWALADRAGIRLRVPWRALLIELSALGGPAMMVCTFR
jgi:D-lactate dehydrogenase